MFDNKAHIIDKTIFDKNFQYRYSSKHLHKYLVESILLEKWSMVSVFQMTAPLTCPRRGTMGLEALLKIHQGAQVRQQELAGYNEFTSLHGTQGNSLIIFNQMRLPLSRATRGTVIWWVSKIIQIRIIEEFMSSKTKALWMDVDS